MALVLNATFPGRSVLRSVMLIPWGMAPVAVGILWSWIFDGSYGTLNALLFDLGLINEPIAWLANGSTAFNLVALVHVWNQAPLTALLVLAGAAVDAREPASCGAHRRRRTDRAVLQDHAALAAADAAADPAAHLDQLDHGLRPVLDHDQGWAGQRHHRVLLDGLLLRLPALQVRRGSSDPLHPDDRLSRPRLGLSQDLHRHRAARRSAGGRRGAADDDRP